MKDDIFQVSTLQMDIALQILGHTVFQYGAQRKSKCWPISENGWQAIVQSEPSQFTQGVLALCL